MKSFKDYVTMNEAKDNMFKKGDSVTIKNAKSYDAMMKDTAEGTVIGAMGGKVMVKVGSGQLNVDPKDLMLAEDSLDEAKMYKSDYLSDDDVRRIAIFTGGSWNKFEKRVNDGVKQYLELILDGAKNIKLDRVDVNGYLIATAQSRLWVKRIQYTFELDGDRHTGEIKDKEIWVTL